MRPLRGPAGDFVHGLDPAEVQRLMTERLAQPTSGGAFALMKASIKATNEASKQMSAAGKVEAPPARYADRNQQYGHEWHEREQARLPYLAPTRSPVLVTRIPSRAKEQVSDVTAHLASTGLAGRPDLVFGAYPVPDHIGTGGLRRGSRYVEWDVVHAAPEALAPSPPPGTTLLAGDGTWVRRASGEPSLLDEDLAVTLLVRAGVGPEQCAGVSRLVRTVSGGGGDDGGSAYVRIEVVGAQIFGPAGFGDPVRDQLAQVAPFDLPTGPPPGVHIEVLNWRVVTKAVHPDRRKPFPVPSLFAYLPSTPQELLKAYLDIVGVSPADCYAASVTEDGARDLLADQTGHVRRNYGEEQPCVDGKGRGRLHGGRIVVVAYRDATEYAVGRERWEAYQRDVLQADLALGTGARRPVEAMEYGSLSKGLRRLITTGEKVIDFFDMDSGSSGDEGWPAPHRYCWPPTDAR